MEDGSAAPAVAEWASRPTSAVAGVPATPGVDPVDRVAALLSGCRDDADGFDAKKEIVKVHVVKSGLDLLSMLCGLHQRRCLVIDPDRLLAAVSWQTPIAGMAGAAVSISEASVHPGFFLTSVLTSCPPTDMLATVKQYLLSNPSLDQVESIAQQGPNAGRPCAF